MASDTHMKKPGMTDSDGPLDAALKEAILQETDAGKLPCAKAFRIAETRQTTREEIGRWADRLDIRLNKCQLGLFGYTPDKKIIAPADHVDDTLREAIASASTSGRISCKQVWDIAAGLDIARMNVSSACEAMRVKITHCQLGAF